MSGIKKLLLLVLASGTMIGPLAVSAGASCIPLAPTGITHTGDERSAAGTREQGSPTCWQTERSQTSTEDRFSRITVSQYSLGQLIDAMTDEGFRAGYPLLIALENLRSALSDQGVTSAAYAHPSDDCHVYAQAANGQPDLTQPVAALWWPVEGGCRALKELIGVAVADHMDNAVLFSGTSGAASEYDPDTGALTMTISSEPAPISFAWLFVAYHQVDVSKLPAELGFVDRLAGRIRTLSFPYHVQGEDTLSDLAIALTGMPGNYRLLHAINRERLSDPDMIQAGDTIQIPPAIEGWVVAPVGDDPTAISSSLYGTPVFASTVAGLCGGETPEAGYNCLLPVWRDPVAITEVLEWGDGSRALGYHPAEKRM